MLTVCGRTSAGRETVGVCVCVEAGRKQAVCVQGRHLWVWVWGFVNE